MSELKFIASTPFGEEIDYMSEVREIDVDLGDTNDFQFQLPVSEWTKRKYWYGNRIFIPDTEYGGIIDDIQSDGYELTFGGLTWRGLLMRKVVEPPTGQDHLVLNGEINSILRDLIKDRFDGLFFVPEISTDVAVKDWQVDRYVTLYDAITKLLTAHKHRMQIVYVEPDGLDYGYVSLQAVPIKDYSEELEYSQESEQISLTIEDYRGGINHLVCAGEGQNEERVVLHLYVQEDGSIGKMQFYKGLAERAEVYNFTSADLAQLEADGTKRLKELQNYKKCNLAVDDGDYKIGDIIAGYDTVTETYVQKPIIGKILNIQGNTVKIEYRVKGDD